jgi:hypothetical protein
MHGDISRLNQMLLTRALWNASTAIGLLVRDAEELAAAEQILQVLPRRALHIMWSIFTAGCVNTVSWNSTRSERKAVSVALCAGLHIYRRACCCTMTPWKFRARSWRSCISDLRYEHSAPLLHAPKVLCQRAAVGGACRSVQARLMQSAAGAPSPRFPTL